MRTVGKTNTTKKNDMTLHADAICRGKRKLVLIIIIMIIIINVLLYTENKLALDLTLISILRNILIKLQVIRNGILRLNYS